MAKPVIGKRLLVNGSVHPVKINGGINSRAKRTIKSDNLSLASVSTVSSSIQLTNPEGPPGRAISETQGDSLHGNVATKIGPAVIITELSEEETELQFEEDSPPTVPPIGGKLLNGLKGGTVAQKWVKAGKQVRRAVVVTQAFQRPETRQEKVRKQLYGSKAALPVLPVPVAIILLVMNTLIPGSGTVVAGFTFCCCATTYDKPNRKGIWEKVPGLVYKNILVGLAQLFTTSFLLVGWFWSIAWGVTMVQLAIEREREKKEGSDWFPDAID